MLMSYNLELPHKYRNLSFSQNPSDTPVLTLETSCGIQMLLFQSLFVTTNCSAFCHSHSQACETVICLLFVLVPL